MCVRFCKIHRWFRIAKLSTHSLRVFVFNVKFGSFAASRPHDGNKLTKGAANHGSHKRASEMDGLIPR